MQAYFKKYILDFKRPAGTSRGTLEQKETYFLFIKNGEETGIGECNLFKGLSADDRPDYEEKLQWVCDNISKKPADMIQQLQDYPSICFGYETALKSLQSVDGFELFPTVFTQGVQGIPTNGLIWMGEPDFMKEQIAQKLDEGFSCLKMKIGALDFDSELDLLRAVRNRFRESELTLRVDANGAFRPDEALEKLQQLAKLDIHSIEQPIRQGQPERMAELCSKTPIPVALDEELIGVHEKDERENLLADIRPQYIILKPALIGGFKSSREWINIAEENNAGWWVTSALESNVGLNAIAQFTQVLGPKMPQGLGTGGLFTNNIPSPLELESEMLYYRPDKNWDLTKID